MKAITKYLIAAFAAVGLTWFAFSSAPNAFGVTPAPDGGYPNHNTAEGTNSLKSLTTGTDNTAIGFQALSANTDGSFNTATGSQALFHSTRGAFGFSGDNNTANGYQALFSNTDGSQNTATGAYALFNNTTGGQNTANGHEALNSNTTASFNTAIGFEALFSNTTGGSNTATGYQALYFSGTGSGNTATGAGAMQYNDTGSNNTATGFNALVLNTTGNQNTATGVNALNSNDSGNNNTAEGFQALLNTTGSNNIALGANAGIDLTTGSNNIDIGAHGTAGESNTIRIGTIVHKVAYMRGISGATVAGGVGVIVDARGHLGTVQSSARFKDEIKPMDKASEAILALKPVTFRYKKELDPEGIPQFGLVAEDVAKVNPDLVAHDEEGKVYTVRYEAVNAMLLNEFLKEHRTVQELKSVAAKQEAMIAQQQKQIEALAVSLQKVSDQLEPGRPAPQLVADTQ